MAIKKEQLARGVAGLMARPSAPAQDTEKKEVSNMIQEKKPAQHNYKTVCYSIPPDLAERIKHVAYIDRKTIGGVVAEAFREYLDRWEPKG